MSCAGFDGDSNENLSLVVCFVGAVLADSHYCNRSVAFGMARFLAVSPGGPFV
jgi:hypothetical protein